MNRTLFSNKHIKFNPLRNHILAAGSKKKWTLNKSKQQSQIIVRKFSSYTNKNNPPNNYWEIIIIASCIAIARYKMTPPGESSEITNYTFKYPQNLLLPRLHPLLNPFS